jgi:hypothetical protein
VFEKKMVEGLNQGLAKLTLEQRILFINERFSRAAILSKFNWADQYLTWLFTTQNGHVALFADITSKQAEQTVLRQITSERYEISFDDLDEDVPQTLEKFDVWITSSHKTQDVDLADENTAPKFAVWREDLNIIEINPLADFTPDDIELAVLKHEIPVNLAAIGVSSGSGGQDGQDNLIITSSRDRHADNVARS